MISFEDRSLEVNKTNSGLYWIAEAQQVSRSGTDWKVGGSIHTSYCSCTSVHKTTSQICMCDSMLLCILYYIIYMYILSHKLSYCIYILYTVVYISVYMAVNVADDVKHCERTREVQYVYVNAVHFLMFSRL